MSNKRSIAEKAFSEGQGIFRLLPAWVPRSFCRPGRRIKLHPDDYYALGLERGGIDERWLASTTHAENGPGTPADEGLSYIAADEAGQEKVLLAEVVEFYKDQIIGRELWDRYQRWPMFSKFFDNMGPLPHHVHHSQEYAARVSQNGKPEMYFFPAQLNNHGGEFPFTFFGLNPETSKDRVRESLRRFTQGDNQLLDLSRCFKLTLDTGWDVPTGILHAPGSLCTYEPQFASDVYAMYQSVLYGGQCVSEDLLWKDVPADEVGNIEYLLDLLDWDLNVDPDFHKNRQMLPLPVADLVGMRREGYIEEWICYKCREAGAKRLTVLPGRTVTIKDSAAYGFIVIQGHGRCGVWDIESPALIRFGQQTHDEFFVTAAAAAEGVTFSNPSASDPIVVLKHFAANPDSPAWQA